jgi:hypothetical protein
MPMQHARPYMAGRHGGASAALLDQNQTMVLYCDNESTGHFWNHNCCKMENAGSLTLSQAVSLLRICSAGVAMHADR